MQSRYHIFKDKDYYIPSETEERFLYLRSIIEERERGSFPESARGHSIVLESEFKNYLVQFNLGDLWRKKTESWQGNDEIGTEDSFPVVRITKISESFIEYRGTTKYLGLYFSEGERYNLNKWSFLRIFEKGDNI